MRSNMLIILIITILVGLAVSLFFLVDTSISYTYLQSSYDAKVQHNDILLELLQSEWIGATKDEVLSKIKHLVMYEKHMVIIKELNEDNLIMVNEITFVFEGETLIEIK